jgi:hypothetical protein
VRDLPEPVGVRTRGSEHAPDLVDSDGVQPKLTHEHTVTERRTGQPYPVSMNPRARRLIVSGVLGALVLIVAVSAMWNWLS